MIGAVAERGELALVVNPVAGGGRGARLAGPVAARLRGAGWGVEIIIGRSAADADERLGAAVARGVVGIVAVGGDGIINQVAQHVAGTELALGIVPAGTGNDLAGALALPADPLAAADLITSGRERRIDACRTATGHWWVNVLGAGFDAAVNERGNRMRFPRGKRKYDLAIVAELGRLRAVPFTLTLDGVVREVPAVLVAVGNGSSYGAGMRMTPAAVLDDGLLDVTIIGPVSRRTLLRVFPRVYKGTHVTHPAVTTLRARSVGLAAEGQVAYADGERIGPLPVTSTCVPGALRLLGA